MKIKLLAVLLLAAVPTFAQIGGLAPQQTASNPLQIRVGDGDISSVLGVSQFKATNLLLTANSTNYVYLDLSQNPPVLTVNTSGFPTSSVYKIATVTTNATQITAMTDSRPTFNSTTFGAGGLTQVSSLPGTCTTSTAPVQLTTNASNYPYGIYYCSASNVWTLDSTYAGPSTISPTQWLTTWGIKSGVAVPDATTVSGTNTITCPNSDCKFLTGPYPITVGAIVFATLGAGGNTCFDQVGINFGGVLQTTVSAINNDNSINVVGNSDTNATATACLFVGYDNTTAFNNAWAAAGCSATAFLPNGYYGFSAAIFQAGSGCPAATNAGFDYVGQKLYGQAAGGTYLVPVPNFTWTGCGGTGNSTACVGNGNIEDTENFSVFGLGQRCVTTHNTNLMNAGIAGRFVTADGVGWCGRGGGANLVGIEVGGVTDFLNVMGSNYFGSTQVSFNATNIGFGNSYISGNANSVAGNVLVNCNGGATVFSFDNTMAGNLTVTGGCIWNSINSQWSSNSSDACIQMTGTSGTFNSLSGDNICVGGGANIPAIYVNTGSTNQVVNLQQSKLQGGTGASSTSYVLVGATGSGNVINDIQGNTMTAGTAGQIWNGLGTITTAFEFTGKCTGVVTASSTLGLYGTGSNETLLTCTSTTIGNGLVQSKIGVGQALAMTATATAAGTNASSGVITVLKNGSAQTMTCTIGTGTSCQDITHQFSFVQGDAISVQFTSQAADTLAGVTVTVYLR